MTHTQYTRIKMLPRTAHDIFPDAPVEMTAEEFYDEITEAAAEGFAAGLQHGEAIGREGFRIGIVCGVFAALLINTAWIAFFR
jgi:hypothetical protein